MSNRTRNWVIVIIVVFLALSIATCAGCNLLFSRARREETLTVGYGDAVGIIYVEGLITSGSSELAPLRTGIANAPTIIDYLQQAEDTPSVKAILLHINSPGGSVVASDEIHNQLLRVRKPVVAWMGEMAASGGYYIACGADRIVAHPDTLTGSIGVISQIPNVEELMSKLGVEMAVIKSGDLKDEGSMFRQMTEEEQALWQTIINETYEHFVRIVAEGRELDPATVRELADGRVYTGRQALELGLVDQLGNLADAVQMAAELGSIEGQPRLREYRRSPSLLDMLLGSRWGNDSPLDILRLLDIKQTPSLQYLYIGP